MDFCLRCKPRLKTLAAEIFTPSNSTVDSYFTIDEGWICLADRYKDRLVPLGDCGWEYCQVANLILHTTIHTCIHSDIRGNAFQLKLLSLKQIPL